MARLDDQIENIERKVDDIAECIHGVDKELSLHKATFEDHAKQDALMYEELKRMNDILQTNTESLREHMHRTDLLEQMVKKLDERFTPLEVEYIKKEAVNEYAKEKLVLIAKIGGAIVAGATIALYAKKLLLLFLSQP
jgi:hypothetical protein